MEVQVWGVAEGCEGMTWGGWGAVMINVREASYALGHGMGVRRVNEQLGRDSMEVVGDRVVVWWQAEGNDKVGEMEFPRYAMRLLMVKREGSD
jgi:hypothetical protein